MGCDVASQSGNIFGIDMGRVYFSPDMFLLYLSALTQLTAIYYEFQN